MLLLSTLGWAIKSLRTCWLNNTSNSTTGDITLSCEGHGPEYIYQLPECLFLADKRRQKLRSCHEQSLSDDLVWVGFEKQIAQLLKYRSIGRLSRSCDFFLRTCSLIISATITLQYQLQSVFYLHDAIPSKRPVGGSKFRWDFGK